MICESSVSSAASLQRWDFSVGLCVTSDVSRWGHLLLAAHTNIRYMLLREKKSGIDVTFQSGDKLLVRISDGLWKGQRRKRRGGGNLEGGAVKKPVLNYRFFRSPNTRQYIMHTAGFQNVWITGGAFQSMTYRSHILYYALVMTIPEGWYRHARDAAQT